MKFYLDIIQQRDPKGSAVYHYLTWDEKSIRRQWEICSASPITAAQYYPKSYWLDLLAWFKRFVPRAIADVIDVGCGTGNMIECLLEVVKPTRCWGVDISDDALSRVRARFAGRSDVELRQGGFEHIPLDDASVDMVVCTEVLEHLFPPAFRTAFTEAARVLKPGGYFLASVPLNEKMYMVCCPECGAIYTPYQHMSFEITEADICAELVQNGMRVVAFHHPVDRSQPANLAKRIVKAAILALSPWLAVRVFAMPGATGFLAVKEA